MSVTATKCRPIIMGAESVKAILAGTKTQTRRVCNPQPGDMVAYGSHGVVPMTKPANGFMKAAEVRASVCDLVCSYGHPGDTLWVREAWGYEQECVGYRADTDLAPSSGWKSPLHMRHIDSRITLEVVGVRVERLQDIGKDGRKAHGVIAEGITDELIEHQRKFFHADDSPALAFAAHWDKINGKKHPWSSNPWVWVLEFKLVSPSPSRMKEGAE